MHGTKGHLQRPICAEACSLLLKTQTQETSSEALRKACSEPWTVMSWNLARRHPVAHAAHRDTPNSGNAKLSERKRRPSEKLG